MKKRAKKASLTDQIVVRLEPAQVDAIKSAAKIDRRPLAHLVRNILSDYLASRADQQAA